MLFAIIIGGLVGYLFGRLPGFFIGAALGALAMYKLKTRVRQRLQEIQEGFLGSVFSVMGAVCKADGVVTQDEIRMAESMFDRFRLSAEQREQAKAAFARGKASDFDLDAEVESFREVAARQPYLLQLFLQVQVSAVAANGKVSDAEHEILLRIARGLGLPDAQVEQLEAMLRGAQAGKSGGVTTPQQIDDAYKALGVSKDASDAEIKRAYRKLMSANHPDKLAGKGLPDSMREMAEQRTGEISHAYDVIREARKSSA